MTGKSRRRSFGHGESHNLGRRGWLRAGVLGANDGVVSTAALMMALLAAKVSMSTLTLTGASALIAGACSMAIGEYVSVCSQRDVEEANIAKEKAELQDDPVDELDELTGIYRNRGLSEDLARQVAVQLTEKDALKAHLRDELNIVDRDKARPVEAAYVSFIAFSLGGLLPYAVSLIALSAFETQRMVQLVIAGTVTICALGLLGYLGAYLGAAPIKRSVIRVLTGGIAALVVTSLLGAALG